MLLVLTILLMILLVTTQFGYRQWGIQEADAYMEQLLKDIHYTQSLAERTAMGSTIQFIEKNNQLHYQIKQMNTTIKEVALPKQLKFSNDAFNKISFNANGAASSSRQFKFLSDTKQYSVKIYIGEGVPRLESLWWSSEGRPLLKRCLV